MPRGRQANRTDINAAEPITVAGDQQYGDAGQQRAAERAVPIGTPPTPTAPAPRSGGLVSSLGALRGPGAAPGQLPFLEPSTRGLPITHGLPFGDGAGPEAMGMPPVDNRPVTKTFDDLAASPNASQAVSSLADTARSLGV